MKSTQSEFSIRTAFQSYRLAFRLGSSGSNLRDVNNFKVTGAQFYPAGQQQDRHVLNGIPTAGAQGRSTSAPHHLPPQALLIRRLLLLLLLLPSSKLSLEEELVLKVGSPILPTLLSVWVCVHSLRHTPYSHTWLPGTLSLITGPSKSPVAHVPSSWAFSACHLSVRHGHQQSAVTLKIAHIVALCTSHFSAPAPSLGSLTNP